jgi:hypothetical protein
MSLTPTSPETAMKLSLPSIGIALVASLGLALVATPAPSGTDHDLDSVAWLAGHWRQEKDGVVTEELWMPARGGLMLGLNRTSRADGEGRAQFEYLRIEARESGPVYVASPSGKGATPFALMLGGDDHAVFENPEHDFPKILEYRLEDGKLHVAISGDEPGPSWTFERVAELD